VADLREVFADEDVNPVPIGVRLGNVVHLTHLTGADPAGGALAATAEAQMTQAHENLRRAVIAAGASIDAIAHVSFYVSDRAVLPAINPAWATLFPNDADRPTYKFMVAPLPAGCFVQLEAFAVAGNRRQLLSIPGVAHTNPIPMGVKIGNMIFSSRLLPYDAATGKPPADFAEQADHLFRNLRTFLAAGGALPSNITQARLFIADKAAWPSVKHHWNALFTTAERPVLHMVTYGTGTALQIYIEIIACL
jgi:2-iminobutanoate/2-iminopropanoate deaminase